MMAESDGRAETGSSIVLAVNGVEGKHFGTNRQAAGRHLLGEAGEFVEVDLRRTDKRSGARTPQHQTFAFQDGKSVTSGHQADAMNSGKLAFRIDSIAGLQLSAFNLPQDGVLNFLVSGYCFSSNSLHASSTGRVQPCLKC